MHQANTEHEILLIINGYDQSLANAKEWVKRARTALQEHHYRLARNLYRQAMLELRATPYRLVDALM